MRGAAITPDSADYEAARSIWNGTVDKRPALIVRAQGVADVIEAVNYARAQGLPVAVRGGGHHVAGSSLIEGGVVIELSQMRSVRVDPTAQTVRAEGGCQIADVDRGLRDEPYGRTGDLRDPFGHRWSVMKVNPDFKPEDMGGA